MAFMASLEDLKVRFSKAMRGEKSTICSIWNSAYDQCAEYNGAWITFTSCKDTAGNPAVDVTIEPSDGHTCGCSLCAWEFEDFQEALNAELECYQR